MRRIIASFFLAGLFACSLPALASAATVAAPAVDLVGWLTLGLIGVAVLLGTGIIPSGAVGTELTAVTRRAFIPKVIVQIYQSTPWLSGALANAQTASGGVSSITVPVQGTPMVTAQATDYSGGFAAPAVLQGITESDFNLKAVVVPIPFLGMEGIVQLNAAVVPLIEARMNDAGNQVTQYLSVQGWTNNTYGSINIDGWPLIAAATGTYGNIPRASNTWWQANVRAITGSQLPTRQNVLEQIVSATKANLGEMPNMGIMGPGTWLALAQDFIGQEQYMITPGSSFDQSTQGARSAFNALMVGGVPIYIDMQSPEGQLLLYNTRYDSFYIHEAAAFSFTGFASTLPNFQLGYVGALVAVLEHVNVKPRSVTITTGYGSVSV